MEFEYIGNLYIGSLARRCEVPMDMICTYTSKNCVEFKHDVPTQERDVTI